MCMVNRLVCEMAKYSRLLCILFCLSFAGFADGQIELSAGIDVNYPVLLNSNNSKLNYGQFTFGMELGIAYKPEETQFFPILKPSFGRSRLPLKEFGKNVAVMDFNYINLMLNENYVVRFTKSELFLYGGIGFSYLNRKATKIMGSNGENMKLFIDSTANITKVFPAVNVGFEYNYGESAGKDIYITMGLNFQYVLLGNNNNYFITIKEPGGIEVPYSTSISGNLISPSFYLAFHYLLHMHRKHSMYL